MPCQNHWIDLFRSRSLAPPKFFFKQSLSSGLGLLNKPSAFLGGGKTPLNVYPKYDSILSDSDALVLQLWEKLSTPSLSLLRRGRVSSIGQRDMFDIQTIGPVGWCCRTHWLRLCRGVRPRQRVSWIWH